MLPICNPVCDSIVITLENPFGDSNSFFINK